jgi:YgiT-type zinc finger domain-containing protein
MEPGMTTHTVTHAGRTRIFEHVPAHICTQCHEQSFSSQVAALIQRIIREDCPPTRTTEVGVYDLAATPWATAAGS